MELLAIIGRGNDHVPLFPHQHTWTSFMQSGIVSVAVLRCLSIVDVLLSLNGLDNDWAVPEHASPTQATFF